MARYAERTTVTTDKSRTDIERDLMRYGATGFMYGWQGDRAVVGFVMRNRHIKFILPMPSRADYTKTPTGRVRSQNQVSTELDQAVRQRWRALALIIKAKLEAVESGIVEFEEEFLAHIVLPDGSRVGDHMLPQIEASYGSGQMPPLLPDYTNGA